MSQKKDIPFTVRRVKQPEDILFLKAEIRGFGLFPLKKYIQSD